MTLYHELHNRFWGAARLQGTVIGVRQGWQCLTPIRML
jgi:hypothetical protein